MAPWETRYGIVSQVRSLGLLMGVSFAGEAKPDEEFFVARVVRHEMLRRGVWAICDNQAQVRMYPALNLPPESLLEGLAIMEESIDVVQRGGVNVGDYPPMPSGNVGF
jgi:acetylornithine/succinyldiaminopimelate/putrescine aminotransferase